MAGVIFILYFIININAEIIRDSFGRNIEIDEKPQRIIAIGPGALRMIAYLDAIDTVCGVENIEIKSPKGRPYTIAYYEKLKKLPVFGEGGADKRPDYERILRINPQIIIASSISYDFLKELEDKTHKNIIVLNYGPLGGFDTESFKDSITKLGYILKKQKRAEFIKKRIDSYISDIKKRVGDKKIYKSIYIGGISFKGSHGITSTQIDYEPFKIIGIKSVVDESRKNLNMKHLFIDKETLLSLNPDLIFIDIGGIEIIEADYTMTSDYYKNLKAFKNNNIYTTLPFNFYTTNVEVVFVNSYFYAKILYPDSFKDIEMKDVCSRIFIDFVGKDVCNSFIENNNFYKRIMIDDGKFKYY